MEAAKEMKFGTYGDEDDARTSNPHVAQRKYMIPQWTMIMLYNMTSIAVIALGNQPIRFTDGAL